MLLFDLPEFFGRIANRLLPADRGEFPLSGSESSAASDGGQQLSIVKKIPAVIAFQAQLILIGDPIGGFRTDNFIVVDNQLEFATRPAIRANARDFFISNRPVNSE
jgi:hypothetical protein